MTSYFVSILMVKALTTLFLISFSLAFSFDSLKQAEENEDCDLFIPCDLGLTCYDYRCQVATPNKTDIISFAPEGPKCNWFHHCIQDYECNKHRCELKQTITSFSSSVPIKSNKQYNLKAENVPNQQLPNQGGNLEQNKFINVSSKQQTASQLAQEVPQKPISYYNNIKS